MEFLTTGEAADALHVTIPTVKRWVREGHLKAIRTAGGHHRIAEDEIARFLARATVTVGGERARVLVVDDDANLRDTLLEALTMDGRYAVEVAADGYEGLLKVGTFWPHVLLLDLRMPGLDGFHVCRKVKEQSRTSNTKILAMTGYAEGNARERALEAGADGFLDKPIDLAVLHAEVERLAGVASKDQRAALPLPLGTH